MGKNETAGPSVTLLTVAVVAAMIAEAVKNLVTPDQVKELITESQKDLATKHEVAELLTKSEVNLVEYVNSIQPLPAVLSSTTEDNDAPQPLDPDWLEGLRFSSATQKVEVVDGRKRMVATPIERELRPADVLAYRVADDQVFLVTADGQKHTVEI